MNTSEWIAVGGIAAGLFGSTIGSALYLSYKIGGLTHGLTTLEKRLDKVQDDISKINECLVKIRIEIAEMQLKLEVLWKAHLSESNSPVRLNDAGREMLLKSNIGAFAEERYSEILSKVKALKPDNAYQAQEVLLAFVGRYKKDDDCKLRLQVTAFSCGYDIDSLLFVAALSIRDRIISDLGFGQELIMHVNR